MGTKKILLILMLGIILLLLLRWKEIFILTGLSFIVFLYKRVTIFNVKNICEVIEKMKGMLSFGKESNYKTYLDQEITSELIKNIKRDKYRVERNKKIILIAELKKRIKQIENQRDLEKFDSKEIDKIKNVIFKINENNIRNDETYNWITYCIGLFLGLIIICWYNSGNEAERNYTVFFIFLGIILTGPLILGGLLLLLRKAPYFYLGLLSPFLFLVIWLKI